MDLSEFVADRSTFGLNVSEFAILNIKVDNSSVDLHDTLRRVHRVQNQWVREHCPHLLEGKPYKDLSTFFLFARSPDVANLLITASWDFNDRHYQWIKSDENNEVYGRVAKLFVEGKANPSYFGHFMGLEPDEPQLRGDLFAQDSPVRVLIASALDRDAKWVASWCAETLEEARTLKPDARVWAGRKIGFGEDRREFIIVWTQNVLDSMMDELLELDGMKHNIWEFQALELPDEASSAD